MKMRTIGAIAVAVGISALAATYRVGNVGKTARVEEAEIARRVYATAEVIPKGGIEEVRPRIDGVIRRVDVGVGDHVTVGQLLAEIDTAQRAAELRQYEAQRDALAEQMTQLSRPAQALGEQGMLFRIAEAEAEERSALARLARLKSLLPGGTITAEAVETSQLEAEAAIARRRGLQVEQEIGTRYKNPTEERAARARLRAAQAAAEAARRNAEFGRIESLIDGTVLSRNVNVGDVVSVAGFGGRPLFEIANLDTLELRAEVSAEDAQRVPTGQVANVFVAGSDERAGTARVRLVGPRMERRSIGRLDPFAPFVRNMWLDVQWDPAHAGPSVGQTFEVRIQLEPRRVATTVPREAVSVVDGEATLQLPHWLFNKASRVRLGVADEHRVEIFGVPVGATVLLPR
jgi:HlyD family secretion protein